MNTAVCLLMSLISAFAQNTGLPPATRPFIIMDTLPMRALGNYSIGSLPYGLNSTACKRIGMFKFPALASGIASSITMNLLPTVPATCTLSFNLYEYSKQIAIGYPLIGTFNTGGSVAGSAGLGAVSITVNASRANWLLSNGTIYYMVIQTATWNSAGMRCNMKVPYGLAAPPYAVVIQQGPSDQPCDSNPWTTVTANDGGFIQMQITGAALSNTPTATPSRTPVAPADVSPSCSITPSPSGSETPSPSGSETPSPSGSMTPSPSGSITPSPSGSITPSPSGSITPMVSNSATTAKVPINTTEQMQAAAAGSAAAGAIAGGVVGGLAVVGMVTAAIMILGNTAFKAARSPVSSNSVITMNPANQMMHFHTNV